MKPYTKYNPEPGTIRGPWFQPHHGPSTRWSYAIRTDSEAWTYAQESTQAAAKQRAEELAAKYCATLS